MNDEWQEGRDAYNEGEDKSDCPYNSGQKRTDWIHGWESAWNDDDSDDRLPD
jgi:ribosome modulation factor